MKVMTFVIFIFLLFFVASTILQSTLNSSYFGLSGKIERAFIFFLFPHEFFYFLHWKIQRLHQSRFRDKKNQSRPLNYLDFEKFSFRYQSLVTVLVQNIEIF